MSPEQAFLSTLPTWYEQHHRPLPWRGTKDPYRIWLSEIILQQTRTQQGLPYYLRFLKRFPTLRTLAESSEEELLRCWQGLGYYTRARNMHQAAQTLISDHQGHFPRTPTELEKIKGIGPYTAAAVASFAFGYPSPVLDGNVFRLLARYFGITADISAPSNRALFTNKLQHLISSQDPALFNQSIMEFGAQQCRPKPRCSNCPLQAHCFAFLHQKTSQLPHKASRRPLRSRYFHYFVLETPTGLYLRKRQARDIWKSLYDFPVEEAQKPLSWHKIRQLQPLLADHEPQKTSNWHQHLLTHQRIMARFFHFTLTNQQTNVIDQEKQLRHTSFEEIDNLPKPILIANYLKSQKILLF